jgi:hypothetical protein
VPAAAAAAAVAASSGIVSAAPAAPAAPAADVGSSELPRVTLARFLDCSNDLCAAAVEVVDLCVKQRLQQQGQGQGRKLIPVAGTPGVSWLAQQWLQSEGGVTGAGGTASAATAVRSGGAATAGAAAAGRASAAGNTMCGSGGGVSGKHQAHDVPDLAVAKQLLAAATGVDQLLKQVAGRC